MSLVGDGGPHVDLPMLADAWILSRCARAPCERAHHASARTMRARAPCERAPCGWRWLRSSGPWRVVSKDSVYRPGHRAFTADANESGSRIGFRGPLSLLKMASGCETDGYAESETATDLRGAMRH
eukprot:3457478-Pleurochrysis_carterae.AAC.1